MAESCLLFDLRKTVAWVAAALCVTVAIPRVSAQSAMKCHPMETRLEIADCVMNSLSAARVMLLSVATQ